MNQLIWNSDRVITSRISATLHCVERPVAEKSRWRHIRLAITPRYLGNHASLTKIYYGTLSGSHGCFFRIRHEKSRGASPGGGLTMTSYPVGNRTLLSRKPCIADKTLLWNAIRKSWSLLQNTSWKIAWNATLAAKSRWRHIDPLAIKPHYLGNHASQKKLFYGMLSGTHGRSIRIRYEKSREAPPGGGLTMT